MAVPFTQFASSVLDNYDTRLHDSLKAANGVVAIMGMRGRIRVEVGGGPNFRGRVLYAGGSNGDFRGKNAEIPTNEPEGETMWSVPQRFYTTSMVINQIDRDQIRGKWALGNLLEDRMRQMETEYVQDVAAALLVAIPAANAPYSILPSGTSGEINGILSPVAPASAAGTTAGISRADNSWWRNQYTTTAIDMSAEAGDASLYQNAYAPCLFGAAKADAPDFGLTSFPIFGVIGADASSKRRGTLQEQGVSKLGFNNLVYYNATLIQEASTRIASKIAFLNTNYLGIKVLQPSGGRLRQMDQNNNLGSIPLVVREFQRDITTLNDVATGYITFALVAELLRVHGLADNVS